jgi:hypothetical protein
MLPSSGAAARGKDGGEEGGGGGAGRALALRRVCVTALRLQFPFPADATTKPQ